MSGGELLNYTSMSFGAQLLSIPSQQPDPPKHSTPKKGGEDYGRPIFDESSICDDFDRKSSVSSAESPRAVNKAAILSEKARVSSFLDDEMQKRRAAPSNMSTANGRASVNIFNRQMHREEMQRVSSSRDISTITSGAQLLPYGKMPKFERNQFSRPPSSVSDTDTLASSRTSKLAFERGKDKLNFYNVPIGDSLILRLRVWNVDTVQMRIKCSISGDNGVVETNFKILEVTAPIMEPGVQCEIAVQYKPTRVERNYAQLVIERTNCECFKNTFHLLGFGGRAELCLANSNFIDGIAKQTSSNQAIVISPNHPYRFWMEFVNRGQRSAYVKLLATNFAGRTLSNDQVRLAPDQFVLSPSGEARDRWKIFVQVAETFNWVAGIGDGTGRHILTQKDNAILGKRISSGTESTANGRESIMSASSAGASSQQQQQPDCAFRIEAHWGEEHQRQRLKCWQWKSKQLAAVRGINFADIFEGEERVKPFQRQRMSASLGPNEFVDFQNSQRLSVFNVINPLASNFQPSEQPDFNRLPNHNQSRLIRKMLVDESSCHNASEMPTIPNL